MAEDATCIVRVTLTRWFIVVYLIASFATVAAAAATSNTCRFPDPESKGAETHVVCSDDLTFVTSKGVDCSAHKGINCKMLSFFGFSGEEVDAVMSHCPCSCQVFSKTCWSPTPIPSPPLTHTAPAADPDESVEVAEQSEPMFADTEENHNNEPYFRLSTWGATSLSIIAVIFCAICACMYAVKGKRKSITQKSPSTQHNEIDEDADEWNSYCRDNSTKSPTVEIDIEKGENSTAGESTFEASTATGDNRLASTAYCYELSTCALSNVLVHLLNKLRRADEWNSYCSDGDSENENIENGEASAVGKSVFEASTAAVDNRAIGTADMNQETAKKENVQSKQMKPIPQKIEVELIGGIPESLIDRDAGKKRSRESKQMKPIPQTIEVELIGGIPESLIERDAGEKSSRESKQTKPISQEKEVELIGGIPDSVMERDTCEKSSRESKQTKPISQEKEVVLIGGIPPESWIERDAGKKRSRKSKQMKPIPQRKKVVLIGGIPDSVRERDTCKNCSREKKCRKHREREKTKKESCGDSTSKRSSSFFIPPY